MKLKKINERSLTEFINNLFDYYGALDNNSENFIHMEDMHRTSAGWYHYNDGNHEIHVNAKSLMNLAGLVERNLMDISTYYAYVALIVSHEFRHFLQARFAWDGINLDGYREEDILGDELIIYIKLFFDRYYKENYGLIKCEEDATKFSIESSLDFFRDNYDFDYYTSILRVLSLLRAEHRKMRVYSTIPGDCDDIEEILMKIDRRIKYSFRTSDLRKSLKVDNQDCYAAQEYFDLDINRVLNDRIIEKYQSLKNGIAKDYLVARCILSSMGSLSQKYESLESFPAIKSKVLK